MPRPLLCPICSRAFEPVRTWHRFCSPGCRAAAFRNGGMPALEEMACHYCGLLSTGIDHVPPKCTRAKLIHLQLEQRYPFVEVRCCSECNSALGDRPLWTVASRKRYIGTWLKKRYHKYVHMPHWDDREIAALGPGLQRYVVAGLVTKALAQERIAWADEGTGRAMPGDGR